MAQQSVTGSEEPGLTTVLASTLRVMWFRSANSHTGQQLHRCITGRTDGSCRLRATPITACA